MLFSLNYLKKLANLNALKLDNNQIVDALNNLGFEVEGITAFNPKIAKLRFGKVQSINESNNGKGNVFEIEFATGKIKINEELLNLKVGDFVVSTIDEARILRFIDILPDSYKLNGNYENSILIVKDINIKLTNDPIKVLMLEDTIFEVSILPNRADASAYWILAWELSTFFETSFSLPPFLSQSKKINQVGSYVKNGHSLHFFSIKNNFKLAVFEKLLIIKSGINLVNNVIDFGSLIFIMTGQFVSFFDEEKFDFPIKVNTILDSKSNPILVINATEQYVVALKIKAVNDAKNLIMQLGFFSLKEIRRSLHTLKIEGIESTQMQRKIDSGQRLLALRFLSNYLKIDFSNSNQIDSLNKIDYSLKAWEECTGNDVLASSKYDFLKSKLTKLGFKFTLDSVTVPFYRNDLETYQDIDEELLRFYGYHNLVPTPFTHDISSYEKIDMHTNINDVVSQTLLIKGFSRVYTHKLIDGPHNYVLNQNSDLAIKLKNKLSTDYEQISHTNVNSLIKIAKYHLSRNINEFSFFDIESRKNGVTKISIITSELSFEETKNILWNLDDFPLFKLSDLHEIKVNEELNVKQVKDVYSSTFSHLNNSQISGFIGYVKFDTHHKMLVNFGEILLYSDKEHPILYNTNYVNTRYKSIDVNMTIVTLKAMQNYIKQEVRYKNILKINLIDEYNSKYLFRFLINTKIIDEFKKKFSF